MKYIWQYLKAHKIFFILSPLLMLVAVGADLLQPTLMAKIVDKGVGMRDMEYVYHVGGLMLLTTFLGLVCGILSFIFSAKASAFAGEALREDLYKKVVHFGYPELDRFGVATLITRMTNDVGQVQNFLLALQRVFVRAPLMFIGGVIMAIYLAPSLSGILIVAIPFTVLVIGVVAKKLSKYYPKVQEQLDILNGSLRETVLGMRVVKGFCGEQQAIARFSADNESLYSWQLFTQKAALLMSPFLMIAFNFSMVSILWIGGYQAASGVTEVGQIMGFINYLSLILNALIMASMTLMLYARAQASIKRLAEVGEVEMIFSKEGHEIPKNTDILIENVSFHYPEKEQFKLENISFSLAAGERLGIVGPTGSGKSTLLQVIGHLYPPTNGQISIGGIPLAEISPIWLRKNMAYVQQQSTVLSGSIRENLTIAQEKAAPEEMKEALRQAMASELIEIKERSLDSGLNQRGTDLSGGQKQRLSIARALMLKPKILMIDDGTSALDVLTERAFLDELDRHLDCTQIIVAQRIATLKRCHRILVLNEGHLEALGTHEELLEKSPTYRALVKSQTGKGDE